MSEAAIRLFNAHAQLLCGDLPRQVSIYALKERGELADIVVYCSDGQCTRAFAQHFYSVVGADCVWFVGVDCLPTLRNAEYVIGRDDSSFVTHEAFFVSAVVPWASSVIGVAPINERTVVFGYSCGGAFAASMGIRHPDVFGTVLAFSIAGRPVDDFQIPSSVNYSDVRFYFRAGTREPKGMRGYMQRLGRWLRAAHAQIDDATLHGGHQFALWSQALNESLSLAFPEIKQRSR